MPALIPRILDQVLYRFFMSFSYRRARAVRGAVRCYILVALLLVITPVWLWAEAPAWWTQRGVLSSSVAADDYAAVNQGQVKHIAKQAYEEFKAKLPNGPGATLDAVWANPVASIDDYVAINVGQLKNVAKPFYDRLITAGLVNTYPWSNSVATADDYALANIGQVKNLFAFVIPVVVDPNDVDGDGMLDSWEIAKFGDLHYLAGGDVDADGLSNLAEFLVGTNPNSSAAVIAAGAVSLVIFSP